MIHVTSTIGPGRDPRSGRVALSPASGSSAPRLRASAACCSIYHDGFAPCPFPPSPHSSHGSPGHAEVVGSRRMCARFNHTRPRPSPVRPAGPPGSSNRLCRLCATCSSATSGRRAALVVAVRCRAVSSISAVESRRHCVMESEDRACTPRRSPTRGPAAQVIFRHRRHRYNIWCSSSDSGTTSCALGRLRQPARSRPRTALTLRARSAGIETPPCRRRGVSVVLLASDRDGDGRPRCPDRFHAAGHGRSIPRYRCHAGMDSVGVSLRGQGSAPTPGPPWSDSVRLSRTLSCMGAPGLSGSTSFELPCDGRPRGVLLAGTRPPVAVPDARRAQQLPPVPSPARICPGASRVITIWSSCGAGPRV